MRGRVIQSERSEIIGKAWMYWLKHWTGFSQEAWPVIEGVSQEQAEEWLVLVNTEAHKYGLPDSIPEAYKLADVWAAPSEKTKTEVATDPGFCMDCRSLKISQRHKDVCIRRGVKF